MGTEQTVLRDLYAPLFPACIEHPSLWVTAQRGDEAEVWAAWRGTRMLWPLSYAHHCPVWCPSTEGGWSLPHSHCLGGAVAPGVGGVPGAVLVVQLGAAPGTGTRRAGVPCCSWERVCEQSKSGPEHTGSQRAAAVAWPALCPRGLGAAGGRGGQRAAAAIVGSAAGSSPQSLAMTLCCSSASISLRRPSAGAASPKVPVEH